MNGRMTWVIQTVMTITLLLVPMAAWCAGQDSAPVTPSYGLTGLVVALGVVIAILLILYVQNRKRLHKLQEKEAQMSGRISGILDALPLLYMYQEVITDENGVIVDSYYRDVNKCFTDQIYRREECIGQLGSKLFPHSMPTFLKASNLAKQTGKALNFQYYYPGTNRFYDIMVRPCENGRFMEYFCMDCTELHEAQEQLRELNEKMEIALDAAHVTPWRYDLKSNMVYSQGFINDHTGSIKQEDVQLTVQQVYANIHPDDRARVRQAVEDLIDGKRRRIREECRLEYVVGGQTYKEWVEIRAMVGSRDEDGRPLMVVGSRQVITKRKLMEEELRAAKQQAEESNRLKSSFLSNMSHEIRTPLSAIVGFSELLVNAETADERTEYVHIIENNSDLLLQLVNDILDLSKIEAGTVEFTYTDFDLNKLMKEIYDSTQLRMATYAKPVTLTYTLGMEHCIIHSERNRLTQLITNLLTNALKFTEQGTVSYGYERRGDYLYFRVTDTGCGIAKERQKDIFDRFVKLNSHKQGTGLGLSICKSIAETLGGEIGVESEPGKGSTFWFTIRYKSVDEGVREAAAQKAVISSTQRVNILVAEDNESNYKLIKAILSKDYNLYHAWNGREAVDMFSQCHPQLILMDINMPVMDGYEATREIRKLSTDVPILALTAYAYASDEERILNSGMNSYMSKPVNTLQLRKRVETLLRQAFVFL